MASSLFPQQIINRQTGMNQISPQLLNTMNMGTAPQTQNQNNRDQILQLWNTIKNSSNPQQVFEQALMNNPKLKESFDMLKSLSNGNFQQLFYTMAQKQGADANSILGLLK